MNNLLSYFVLVDARISASEKDLPVPIAVPGSTFSIYGELNDSYLFSQIKCGAEHRDQVDTHCYPRSIKPSKCPEFGTAIKPSKV